MQDEESRKRLLIALAMPIAFFIILIGAIHSLFSFGDDELLDYFEEDEMTLVWDALDEYGYEYNYLADDFDMDSLADYEAIDEEAYQKLMDEATKYIGYPYVFGGSSPSTSFDCSGFICWSYTKSGVYNLPRTTAQGIYNQSQAIPSSQAMAGDLIFFKGTYNTGDSRVVTHVGIYLGGNKMLHCGNPISIASTDTSYWQRHFYGYGRILANPKENHDFSLTNKTHVPP